MQGASTFLRSAGIPRAVRLDILDSFNPDHITVRQAGPSDYGLRYYSAGNNPTGAYLFRTFPASRSSLAIKPEWNRMSGFKQFHIEPGATIIEGVASPQGMYLPGGQSQMFILDWRNSLR